MYAQMCTCKIHSAIKGVRKAKTLSKWSHNSKYSIYISFSGFVHHNNEKKKKKNVFMSKYIHSILTVALLTDFIENLQEV